MLFVCEPGDAAGRRDLILDFCWGLSKGAFPSAKLAPRVPERVAWLRFLRRLRIKV